MPRYLQHQPWNQSLLEDLRMVPSWKVVVLWWRKLVGDRRTYGPPVAHAAPWEELAVPAGDVPDEAREHVEALLREVADRVDPEVLWQLVPRIGLSSAVSATARLRGGEGAVRVVRFESDGAAHLSLGVFSALRDGRIAGTSNQPRRFSYPSSLVGQSLLGAPLARLVAAHLEWLPSVGMPEHLPDLRAAARLQDRIEDTTMGSLLARGVFRELTPEEVADASAAREDEPPITDDPWEQAVLEHVRRDAAPPTSARRRGTVAMASLLAFVVLGSILWRPSFAILLGLVLVLHEVGHFVALRAFGVQGLHMVFVPFVGGAVVGRQRGLPAWKRVVASLAGPVPGIAVGIACALAAARWDSDVLGTAATLLVVINGLNLAPVLPLDGGWIVHALVFNRHPRLETAFRVGAAVLMLAWAWSSGSFVLGALGVLMLTGVPVARRIARVAGLVRADPSVATAGDVPVAAPTPAASLVMARAVREDARPAEPPSPPIAAQVVLAVHERVTARPAGLLASAGLLAVHGLAVIGACAGLLLTVGASDMLPEDEEPGASSVEPLPHAWPGAPAVESLPSPAAAVARPGESVRVVSAVVDDEAAARAAAGELAATLRPGEVLTRVGRVLLVATAAPAVPEWTARLEPLAHDVMEAQALAVQCSAPDAQAARRLADTIDVACTRHGERPVRAPWSTTAPRTPEEDRAWRSAFAGKAATRAAFEELSRPTSARRLRAHLMRLVGFGHPLGHFGDVDALTREALDRELARQPDLDPDMAALHAGLATDGPSEDSLGLVDDAEPVQRAVACDWGWSFDDGRTVDAFVAVERVDLALTAIASWMEAQSCSAVSFAPTRPDDYADDEPPDLD